MQRKDRIEKAYKSSNRIYDDALTGKQLWAIAFRRIFWDVGDYEIASRVLRAIPDGFSGKLLDVPVGTAVFTCGKYKDMPCAEIKALDYSEDMLALAKNRFKTHGIKNVSCEKGDVSDLPYADENFDVVLSMNGYHVFPNKERAFSETARVLKHGGVLCGCCYIRGEFVRTDFLINRFFVPMGWCSPPFYSKEELEGIFKTLFSFVDVQNMRAMAFFRCVK
jgi:ubiquinone/menaquinone biosynthesis C-methylase UbiE